jgi:putative endonuclease
MEHYCYIIFSPSQNNFYVGETEDFQLRLSQHNLGFYLGSYTKNINDWEKYLVILCPNRTVARKVEAHIKSMKSRKYYESLRAYPEIAERLLKRYK